MSYPLSPIRAVFLIGVLSLVGCSGKSESPSAKPDTSTTSVGDNGLNSEDYCAEFAKDREAAKNKYSGKELTLTGKVQAFELSGQEEAQIIIGDSVNSVVCKSSDKEPWSNAIPGQLVTIKGKQSPDGNLMLMDCYFVEAKSSALPVSAPDLVKDYLASRSNFHQKYLLKWLSIEGEVASVQKDIGTVLVVKGTDNVRVTCSFVVDFQKPVQALVAGQKVKVLAECQEQFDSDRLHFNGCMLVTK